MPTSSSASRKEEPNVNRALIDQYEADGDLLAKAIAGLTPEEMLAHPIPGTWSVQEVILHLMDSDLVGSDRMKRVIAEPNPTLLAYDENLWIKHLGYHQLDAATACEVFRLNRKMTAAILRQLPDESFKRTGNHTERGVESLEMLVKDYIEHLHHHLKFVAAKRERLRKPMFPK
jgi:DinB superfamily